VRARSRRQAAASFLPTLANVESLDEVLRRVWQLALEGPSDQIDEEIDRLLPNLIDAGYVDEFGHSPTGSLWRFTEKGVQRVEALGCD
jgi:hypothetical protein